MLTAHLMQSLHDVLAAPPSPSPSPTGDGGASIVNTDGIVGFFAFRIGPILAALVGAVMITRANRGEVSRVMTSGMLTLIGFAFIAGAGTLFFIGDKLVALIVNH